MLQLFEPLGFDNRSKLGKASALAARHNFKLVCCGTTDPFTIAKNMASGGSRWSPVVTNGYRYFALKIINVRNTSPAFPKKN